MLQWDFLLSDRLLYTSFTHVNVISAQEKPIMFTVAFIAETLNYPDACFYLGMNLFNNRSFAQLVCLSCVYCHWAARLKQLCGKCLAQGWGQRGGGTGPSWNLFSKFLEVQGRAIFKKECSAFTLKTNGQTGSDSMSVCVIWGEVIRLIRWRESDPPTAAVVQGRRRRFKGLQTDRSGCLY